jgi:hypothetical protein
MHQTWADDTGKWLEIASSHISTNLLFSQACVLCMVVLFQTKEEPIKIRCSQSILATT